jgi:hypothetical protein
MWVGGGNESKSKGEWIDTKLVLPNATQATKPNMTNVNSGRAIVFMKIIVLTDAV